MIKIEIPIDARLMDVWACLVEETNEWWGPKHYTSSHTKRMELQDYIGGKLMEDFGNREGIVWADVIGVKTPDYIMLKGHLAPEYGGPNISFSKISLEFKNNETSLHFEESWLQTSPNPNFEKNLQTGWNAIFTDLKEYVETNYPRN